MREPEYIDFGALEVPPLKDLEWYEQQNGHANPALESGWIARALSSVSDEPPVAPELALGLLYPGKRHVFSGPQESAKTLAAYLCGLEVVRSGRPIVLVDFEMGEYDAKRRMRELGASDDELERMAYVEPQSPATPLAIERLISQEPALVIVDAAAGAFQVEGLDDNSRKDVEIWSSSWIAPFWREQIATLVLDHVTKNAETRGNYAIGSERKVGGVDVHIGFAPIDAISRGGSGRYKLTTHKDRGGFLKRGRLADMVLESDPDTHALSSRFVPFQDSETDYFRPTRIMEAVSRYLELQPEPVSRGDVKEHSKHQAKDVVSALDALLIEEFTHEATGAHGAKLVRSIRPFREDEDASRSVPFSPVLEQLESSRSAFSVPIRTGTERTTKDENGSDSETSRSDEQIEF